MPQDPSCMVAASGTKGHFYCWPFIPVYIAGIDRSFPTCWYESCNLYSLFPMFPPIQCSGDIIITSNIIRHQYLEICTACKISIPAHCQKHIAFTTRLIPTCCQGIIDHKRTYITSWVPYHKHFEMSATTTEKIHHLIIEVVTLELIHPEGIVIH